jgi:hypothetical protein
MGASDEAQAGGPPVVDPAAREILGRAIEAAGGDSWRRPRTLQLSGWADYFPRGRLRERIRMDTYSMDRVFPGASEQAHRANGQVRFVVRHGELLFLRQVFDGRRSQAALGEEAKKHADHFAWKNNFGFGIIRFADGPGFGLACLADDQVEGHACHFIEVLDKAGQTTVFGIDRESSRVRLAAFDTLVGFQQRLYSDFAWADAARGFLQPQRVRIFFDGAKWFDIRWERVVLNEEIPDATFRIPEDGVS